MMTISKAALFARACVVVFLIYLPLSWLWNWATENSILDAL